VAQHYRSILYIGSMQKKIRQVLFHDDLFFVNHTTNTAQSGL